MMTQIQITTIGMLMMVKTSLQLWQANSHLPFGISRAGSLSLGLWHISRNDANVRVYLDVVPACISLQPSN